MSHNIKIIGDVHGNIEGHTDKYLDIAKSSEYSIQVGDFGYSKSWNKLGYSKLNPSNHKILGGNHDDYDTCPHSPYYLGDYGLYTLNNFTFFFIRGGLSIDRVYSVGNELSGSPKTWWSQEELNLDEMIECMEVYRQCKPDYVISHVPPSFVIDWLYGARSGSVKSSSKLSKYKFHNGYIENTARLSSILFKIHEPKMWVAGHHHVSYAKYQNNTLFKGLSELEIFEV